ncbi:MAG: tRNA (adenosine(37)-N6)-dimethylallyltransferase MiaA [Bacilli bacterium]|nr:tRNA (adenosine(37)-N6)-dimethylallyltransferase MiaA [Bacilli bacterium]
MLIVIVGPTGCGKTEIALKLADFYHAPIINADAFQIYKGMDIGTAKIERGSEDYKRHSLLDIITPNQTYSVKQYQEDFRKTYLELKKTSKNIIVCGGTGLYIKAALYDYHFEDEEEVDLSDLESLSNNELYELLKKLDPKAAESIHMNNRKRVIRAIQIARTHNTNKSESIDKQEHALYFKEETVKFYFLNPNRDELYEKINARVDLMMEKGLVNEVQGLLRHYNFSQTARAAIGYKEVIEYLQGDYSLEECIELIKKRTRNYAKRQVTFFKHQLPCIEFDNKEALLQEAMKK